MMNTKYFIEKEKLANFIYYFYKEHNSLDLLGEIRLYIILYFLQIYYIENFTLYEEYGVIEQDNFYPKYLFKQNFEVSTYGVLDKDIEFYDLSDEDFEINNKFEKEIFDYIISILEESLIRSDFQLVDKIHKF